jgi:hypothetical protein
MSLPNKQISHPLIEYPLTDKKGMVTTFHMDWLNSIKPILENTITNQYISTPHIASDQIAKISKPQFGMEVYDTDANKRRVNENGSWKYYNTSSSQFANSTPGITTEQRDALNSSHGDFIVNNDINLPQIYLNGVWKTLNVS